MYNRKRLAQVDELTFYLEHIKGWNKPSDLCFRNYALIVAVIAEYMAENFG